MENSNGFSRNLEEKWAIETKRVNSVQEKAFLLEYTMITKFHYLQEYNEENKEQIKEQRASYRLKNKSMISKKHAEYQSANRDVINEKRKEWRNNDKPNTNQKQRLYRNKKKANMTPGDRILAFR